VPDPSQMLHDAATAARCAIIEIRRARSLPRADALARLEAASVALRTTREALGRALASLPDDAA
jgi:hypothetical protein